MTYKWILFFIFALIFSSAIRMREELFLVSKKIKERNKSRSKYFQYDYLDPELIPNSIAIWTDLSTILE